MPGRKEDSQRTRLIVGFIFVCLLVAIVVQFRALPKGTAKSPASKPIPDHVSSASSQNFDQEVQRVATRRRVVKSNASGFSPSPLTARHFPKGTVVDVREEVLPNGEIHRVELVKTTMKYPLIRVESRVRMKNDGTEQRLFVHEAAADHVVVELQKGKTERDLAKAIQAVNGEVTAKVPLDYSDTFIVSLPNPGIDSVPQAIAALSPQSDIIKVADADGVAHTQSIPNDTAFGDMWSLRNVGGFSISGAEAFPDCDIDAPEAWEITTGQSSVIIAMSDTGFDYNHVDLRPNVWTNINEFANSSDDDKNGFIDDRIGWNFVNNNATPMDDVGHGTHVAGVIGAKGNNGIGIAGLCWNCRLMPIRVLDDSGGFNTDIAAGFDYARKMGARIINASHGGTSTAVVQTAVNQLEAAGVLLVAAAGNEGENADTYPLYPAAYPNSNIISVGYSNHRDELSVYSNFGTTSVDLIAPGVTIYSTAPNNSYDAESGSSFASPEVAGVAALIKSIHPDWSCWQIRSAILSNVDVKPQFAGLCATGGRLNAYKALSGKLPLKTALDNNLAWTTGGNVGWTGRSELSHDGVDAAESSSINDNQQSWMQTTVTGPGTIYFWWKVSSENGWDYLRFLVDGNEYSSITGEIDWNPRSYQIDSGVHTLMWRYDKDYSRAEGDDRALVDQVSFIPPPPVITAQPVGQHVMAGSSVSLSVGASGAGPLMYQWRKNGTNVAGATNSRLTFSNVQAGNAGNYTVRVSNDGGALVSSVATLDVCTIAANPQIVNLPFAGGVANITVTESGTCGWTATKTNSWLTLVSGASGSGTQTLTISASTNVSDISRVGFVTIAGLKVIVTQAGRFAPSSFGQQQLRMTVTNGTGSFATNGAYFLFANVTSNAANAFKIVPLDQANPADQGRFAFSRADALRAWLTLTGQVATSTIELSFASPSSGSFIRTSSTGDQQGTFVMQQARPDFNRDGFNDFILQSTNGTAAAWLMRGTNLIKSIPLRSPGSASICGVADFLNRGETDIVLQQTNGQVALWLMSNRTNFSKQILLRGGLSIGTGWNVVAVADLSGDKHPDLLLQHTDGRVTAWLLSGTNFVSTANIRPEQPAGYGWRIVGVSDFNNDGQLDLLWQNPSAQLSVWYLAGTTYLWNSWLIDSQGTAGWKPVAINDYNSDGRNDVVFQYTDRRLAAWFLNGRTLLGKAALVNNQPVAAGWRVAAPH